MLVHLNATSVVLCIKRGDDGEVEGANIPMRATPIKEGEMKPITLEPNTVKERLCDSKSTNQRGRQALRRRAWDDESVRSSFGRAHSSTTVPALSTGDDVIPWL